MRTTNTMTLAGLAAIAAIGFGASPSLAACKNMGFLVNDYGKDGPTKDAKDLLDKHIAKEMAAKGIKKYQTGAKTVKCDLFLDVGLFDEHTCTARATVCWDGAPLPKSEQAEANGNEAVKPPASTSEKSAAKPTAKSEEKSTAKASDKKPDDAKPEDKKSDSSTTTGSIEKSADEKPAKPSATSKKAAKPKGEPKADAGASDEIKKSDTTLESTADEKPVKSVSSREERYETLPPSKDEGSSAAQ